MSKHLIIPDEIILNKIYLIRGQKVMIDRDLAELYGVETKRLKEQVNRNMKRFPNRYMFKLTKGENDFLRSHFATLKRGEHSKYLPYAFTEHGILQLANVLHSDRAIQMGIRIIDVFIYMNEKLLTHKDILLKLEELEKKLMKQDEKMNKYGEEIQTIFNVLKQMMAPPQEPRKRIGYKRKDEN